MPQVLDYKPIPGYEGLLEINHFGSVRRLPEKRVLNARLHTNGYWIITVSIAGKRYKVYLHRAMAKTFIPNPNNRPQVNHIDGDKTNSQISNLEWVTDKQNKHHAWRTDLMEHILDETQVKEIRNKYKHRIYTMKMLAEEYGVDLSNISRIILRKTWKIYYKEMK